MSHWHRHYPPKGFEIHHLNPEDRTDRSGGTVCLERGRRSHQPILVLFITEKIITPEGWGYY